MSDPPLGDPREDARHQGMVRLQIPTIADVGLALGRVVISWGNLRDWIAGRLESKIEYRPARQDGFGPIPDEAARRGERNQGDRVNPGDLAGCYAGL